MVNFRGHVHWGRVGCCWSLLDIGCSCVASMGLAVHFLSIPEHRPKSHWQSTVQCVLSMLYIMRFLKDSESRQGHPTRVANQAAPNAGGTAHGGTHIMLISLEEVKLLRINEIVTARPCGNQPDCSLRVKCNSSAIVAPWRVSAMCE